MFQFTGFASQSYVFRLGYSLLSGFPHSDIGGSKLHCQLPPAFRRLARPSSPVIAKASTTCTYSLDPITLSPGNSTKTLNYRNTSRACANPRPRLRTRVSFDTITTLCRFAFIPETIHRPRLKPRTVTLYFSRLLKNSRCTSLSRPHLPVKKPEPTKPL